jgi:hypothetical protein
MQYIKVKWIHSHADYPVLLYSELDKDRHECRKVEFYADGRIGFASTTETTHLTSISLGVAPVPTLDEIAADAQFQPVEITKNEFEEVWLKRQAAKGLLE